MTARTVVRVETGHPYDVLIEAGALSRAAEILTPFAGNGRLVVVADAHVVDPHLARIEAALPVRVERIVIPAGEPSKSWQQLEALCDRLLQLEIERGEAIVALGGGVIGDLTGFAAAIVKRGCRFVQVPTTLLAQVDSSVGGKTAINTGAGKNLIGAFHQPDLVVIDPDVLDTLGAREVRAGYAEVVKYGLIDDLAFFDWCEANVAALLAGDPAARIHAIATSVAAKARIVSADEREMTGTRALLNLGHTFGHALEAETGFSDRLLHGEAVAAGMAIAMRYSVTKGLCPAEDSARVDAHLAAAGLPIGARGVINASGATLAAHMAHDKKRSGGTVPFLLSRGIGKAFLAKDVSLGEVAEFLDADAS
ncbi:MAG: 3-dehydroquinate synthase [Pseudomonadota bacterium]